MNEEQKNATNVGAWDLDENDYDEEDGNEELGAIGTEQK
jgi:hypothetical protein